VLNYDAYQVADTPSDIPPDLARMALYKGKSEQLRSLQNNVVFLVADKNLCGDMKYQIRRRLGLAAVQSGPQMENLADYQQERVKEWYKKSEAEAALAIHQCYRHLFYPTDSGMGGTKLGHTTIELPSTSDAPGKGQAYICRALKDQKKLLAANDAPDGPKFVRDKTSLKNKGRLTVSELRNEYRKAPNLSILLDDGPLIACIRKGIEQEFFIYREGEQLWGKGDPEPVIRISDNAFVHTMEDAKKHNLWPRPKPEVPDPPAPPPKDGNKGEDWTSAGSDADGEIKEADMPRTLSAEGPLRQALVHLFEDARKRKADAFVSMKIRFFEYQPAWRLHQTLATYRDADISCNFEIDLKSDGVENLGIQFSGTLQKASTIRSFMEPQLRSASFNEFEGEYQLVFKEPLSTSKDMADGFIETMTRLGGGEAYVEAEAAPRKDG
jgi:hypothetical protein